jgi:hypothetical protein
MNHSVLAVLSMLALYGLVGLVIPLPRETNEPPEMADKGEALEVEASARGLSGSEADKD